MGLFPDLEYPYQVRINDGGWGPLHFNDYPSALEEFHAQINELPLCQVTLWSRSENRQEWHLISLANPWNEEPHCVGWCPLCRALDRGEDPWGKRHATAKPQQWVNLFAGRTLAPLFFLTRGTRDLLERLGWPAPPDATGWRYSTDTPDGMVVVEAVKISLSAAASEVIESADTIDYAALAADPACRVDAATLERRARMGWDLDRGEDPWGKRHATAKPQQWVNLFAGRTLAPLFFLTRGTRDLLERLGWPAPPDATGWRYSTDTPDGMVVVEAVKISLSAAASEVIESADTIDYAALAADPACRVDAATLERRARMGWDLERAMYTPMLGRAVGEKAEWFWQKVPGSTAPRRRYLPKI